MCKWCGARAAGLRTVGGEIGRGMGGIYEKYQDPSHRPTI